jgi:hypothetical protein
MVFRTSHCDKIFIESQTEHLFFLSMKGLKYDLTPLGVTPGA